MDGKNVGTRVGLATTEPRNDKHQSAETTTTFFALVHAPREWLPKLPGLPLPCTGQALLRAPLLFFILSRYGARRIVDTVVAVAPRVEACGEQRTDGAEQQRASSQWRVPPVSIFFRSCTDLPIYGTVSSSTLRGTICCHVMRSRRLPSTYVEHRAAFYPQIATTPSERLEVSLTTQTAALIRP